MPTRITHIERLENARTFIDEEDRTGRPYAVSPLPAGALRARLSVRLDHLVADFCDTLSGRQFDALRAALVTDLAQADMSIVGRYFKALPTMGSDARGEFEAAWMAADVGFIAQNGMSVQDVRRLGQRMEQARGSKRLFARFPDADVVSFGIAEILRGHVHDVLKSDARIHATEFLLDETGQIMSADPGSVVTAVGKGRRVAKILAARNRDQTRTLVVGDDPRIDESMWLPGTFNVLVRRHSAKHTLVAHLTEDHWKRLGLVVSDLGTLVELLDAP